MDIRKFISALWIFWVGSIVPSTTSAALEVLNTDEKIGNKVGILSPIRPILSSTASAALQVLNTDLKIGDKVDVLSSNGAETYGIYLGSKKVGSLVKCKATTWREAKAMLVSVQRSPNRFIKDAEGNSFPNIAEIEKYFSDIGDEDGKDRQITMIASWPTFVSYGSPQLAWLNYDNGVRVWNESNLHDDITQGRGIAYIQWWKLTLSHTEELSQAQIDNLIADKADIFTMSSMKRNRMINPDLSLWQHENGHAVVQFTDGSWWEIILNNCNEEEKQAIIKWLAQITRALYADADAKTNFLDGIWIQTANGLQYSHPDRGDLFMDENSKSWKPVIENMPGIIIYYAIQK